MNHITENWQPEIGILSTSVRMLQALRDPTRADHIPALRSLEANVFESTFILHMLHIFAQGFSYESSGLTVDLRQLAGLIIKNYVFPHLTNLDMDVQLLMKKELIQVLHDPISDIRKTAAILIGKISESFPIHLWTALLPPIMEYLDLRYLDTKPYSVDGCLQAMKRICEDSASKLSMDDNTRPLDILVPKLLDLMTCSTNVSVRLRALESYNCLLYLLEGPTSIAVNGIRSRNTSFDSSSHGMSGGSSISSNVSDHESVSSNGQGNNNHHRGAQATTRPSPQTSPQQNRRRPSAQQHQGSSPTNSTNNLLANASHPLAIHMHAFIQMLASLSADSESSVRRAICQSITIITCLHVALLEPYFSNICEFMSISLTDREESVAMESCEYWSALLQTGETKRAMIPYLKGVIESLIDRLYLSSEQMESERIEEEEENSGKKELNFKPIHYRNNSSSSGNSNNNINNNEGVGGSKSSSKDETQSNNNNHNNSNNYRNNGNNSNNNNGNSKEEEELSSKWTLRKQAALTLDNIAVAFTAKEVLTVALPKIQACFQTNTGDVLIKESGMLALGALSSGCLDAMSMYIPQIFPYWIENLRDPLPEMRSICCWVISRYSPLFGEAASTAGSGEDGGSIVGFTILQGRQFYVQALVALLERLFDEKPKVQVAACSAICLLVENSFLITEINESTGQSYEKNILLDHLSLVLTSINHAFASCGMKSSLLLVDIIGVLADTIREELAADPSYTMMYLPKLMEKFQSFDDYDPRLFPLLECFTSVFSVIGIQGKQENIAYIYTRCMKMLTQILLVSPQQEKNAALRSFSTARKEDEEDEGVFNKDFAVCSMDVLSALNEGLKGIFVELVNNPGNGNTSRELLLRCIFVATRDELPELRQSAFSLTGEICKFAFPLLTPAVAVDILEACILNLDVCYPFVCNNAAWTIGELAMQSGGEFMRPFLPRIMNLLVMALQTSDFQDHLKVNVAVTIGRLALMNTIEVAEMAEEFFAAWCSVLYYPCPLVEKTQAFQGLLNIVRLYPQVLFGNKTNIYSLLVACVSWNELPPYQVAEDLRSLLYALRGSEHHLWSRVISSFGHYYSVDHLLKLYNL